MAPQSTGVRAPAAGRLDPAAVLAAQRAAGNRAVVQMLRRTGHSPASQAGARRLARQPLVSGADVHEVPVSDRTRTVVVNGKTVLNVDLPESGSISVSSEYEQPEGPSLTVLRIRVRAPAGAHVLLNLATYKETMDAAANRWVIYVEQDIKADLETHVAAGTWVQEVTSDPPPAPKPGWDAPKAASTTKPPAPKPSGAAPVPETPSPTRLDTVLQHMREGRWDTDDLAANLTDAEMASLSPKDRVDLIAEIGSGFVVGDEDEETIDRLLELTPTSDYAAVGGLLLSSASLLKTLDDAIDGEEYKRYLTALTKILVGQRSVEDLFADIGKAPELTWTGSGFHTESATYTVEWTDEGKLHIRRWLGLTGLQMEAPPVDVRPGDMVVVRFIYDEPEAGAKAGEFRPMPAAAFVGLVNLKFKRDAWLAVNIAFIVGGVGGVVGGATKLAQFLAALDVAVNAASLVIDQYRAQIAATPNGQKFLRAWDTVQTVIAVYGLARVAMHLPQAIRSARAAWNAARGAVLEHGSYAAAGDMEKNLVKVEQSLADAEQEAHAPPESSATPESASGAPAGGGSGAASGGKIRMMHGTDQESFRQLGGLTEGRIDVARAGGAHQDFGRGFYLTTDEETALEYAGRRTGQRNAPHGGPSGRVLAYDVGLEDLGTVVDIRPGGNFRAEWERFLEQPPFRLPPGAPSPPGMARRREFLRSVAGSEQRGRVFEEFLQSIDRQNADAIIGPLGDGVFSGITGGRETTQVCIRSQAAADRLNAIMRGTP